MADAISVTNAMQPATATLTSGMSAAEAKTLLDSLGIDISGVLGSNNIQQTVSGKTADISDLLGIRSDIYNNLGVSSAQSAYSTAYANYLNATNQLNKDLTALSGRPVSMSKVVGQQAQLSKVRQGDIEALGNTANVALQNYQALKQEADSQFDIRNQEIQQVRSLQTQFPGAKIKLSDSWDKVIDRIDDYQEELEKEAYKKQLKSSLLNAGLKTSGSTKELEKRLKKFNKEALQAAKDAAALDIEYKKAQIANVKSEISNRGSGSNLLSIAEAQALGVPYGTTKQQAAAMGIVPKDTGGGYLELDDPNDPTNTVYYNPTTKETFTSAQALEAAGIKTQDATEQAQGFWSSLWSSVSNAWK